MSKVVFLIGSESLKDLTMGSGKSEARGSVCLNVGFVGALEYSLRLSLIRGYRGRCARAWLLYKEVFRLELLILEDDGVVQTSRCRSNYRIGDWDH